MNHPNEPYTQPHPETYKTDGDVLPHTEKDRIIVLHITAPLRCLRYAMPQE